MPLKLLKSTTSACQADILECRLTTTSNPFTKVQQWKGETHFSIILNAYILTYMPDINVNILEYKLYPKRKKKNLIRQTPECIAS